MHNKGKILLKMLMFIQFLIITLKIDQRITLEWKQVMVGFMIILFFLVLTGICILVYSFLVSRWGFRESYHEVKSLGLRFLVCNIMSAAFIVAIPIWKVYINDSYHIPTIFALCFTFLTSIFTLFKKT
jgi:hypothetical protein